MEMEYSCSECGSTNVQLNFPVWVDANNIDDKDKYELDFEAQPEKDSNKCWCLECKDHRLLTRKEKEIHPPKSEPIHLDDAPKWAARLADKIENKRTIGALLAGLRLLQQQLTGERHDVMDIASCGGEVEPLTPSEIDGLCEDLNSKMLRLYAEG